MWGNVTHNTRNLVGGILVHCRHCPQYRDEAIRWGSSFCVAAMHFIRNEYEISSDELAGLLTRHQIDKMQDANHAPLFAASMCRNYLKKAFMVDASTPPSLAYGYSIQMNNLEELINSLVAQVSGMERVRSTPLPIVYVTHLRTCLFAYCLLIPYVWVVEWGWSTVPLVAFTAFALFGIEGASNECEIPFDRSRPNHLAIDAYCLVILDAIQGLVVHDANVDMSEKQNECNEEEGAIETNLV
jgi:putative membrane protein